MKSTTQPTREIILGALTRFVMMYSPVTAAWGEERVSDWLGWFLDRGLLFTLFHPDGYVIALTCIRIVFDPYMATDCANAYYLDVLGPNVFVDFALCHPRCKKWAINALWSQVHKIVMTNSPQVTHVNWVRFNSSKRLFRYPVEAMNAKLGNK
jgi:hypothetical protein